MPRAGERRAVARALHLAFLVERMIAPDATATLDFASPARGSYESAGGLPENIQRPRTPRRLVHSQRVPPALTHMARRSRRLPACSISQRHEVWQENGVSEPAGGVDPEVRKYLSEAGSRANFDLAITSRRCRLRAACVGPLEHP